MCWKLSLAGSRAAACGMAELIQQHSSVRPPPAAVWPRLQWLPTTGCQCHREMSRFLQLSLAVCARVWVAEGV